MNIITSFLNAKAKTLLNKHSGEKDANIDTLLKLLESQELYPDFPVVDLDANEPICIKAGQKYHMFCSNNYLSLSKDPEILEAFVEGARKYGLGPGGSRVVNGNYSVTLELEQKIADLTGHEACLLLPTGYMANIGIVRSLMDPLMLGMPNNINESVLFSDEFNHGSVVDGCQLSKAKKIIFRHGDLKDLAQKLESNRKYGNKLILTEGVFSTEGEITPIDKYVELAKEYNARLMVDDAHAVGVLGENGGGSGMHLGCSKDIDISMGSMDKAFGGIGGYLCGTKRMIKYLNISMRSSILSSSYPASFAHAMLLTVKKVEESRDRRAKLLEMSQYLRKSLVDMGFTVLGNDCLPAVPVLIGKEDLSLKFNRKLMENRIFTGVFRWPAVPNGKSRLRLTLMYDHQREHLDHLLNIFSDIGKEMKIIK